MLEPGSRLGVYEIGPRIGAGGMGEVYQATDTRLHRQVAIKVSAEQFAERFEAEAKLIAALNHPNICTLHDVGPNYLVMELVEGATLADRIAEGPIRVDEALAIAEQIQVALGAAHDRGIIHRDLKPGNIKIKPDGSVKVLDFGLAKLSTPVTTGVVDLSPTMSLNATHAGVIVGTAAYMAPEQARGKAVDKRADIWAFGVVLYEMLTGRRLFAGESLTDTLAAIIERDIDLSAVPDRVRPLIRACLQKDPRRRLQDIGDAKLLLDPTPGIPARAGVMRRTGWPAVAAVVVLLLTALAFVHFREQPAPAPSVVRFELTTAPLATGVQFYMAVSPDGRKLAYTGVTADGTIHIFVRLMEALEARMVPGTEGAVSLFWSPDSRFIGFGQANHLKKVDATGVAPPITIAETKANVGIGTWSRDNVIVFGGRGAGSGGLRRVSASGGVPADVTAVAATESNHSFPVFLPDGRHFLYLRITDDAERRGIYVGSIDAPPDAQSKTRAIATRYGAHFVQADDGHGRVLFLSENTLMVQRFDLERFALVGEPLPVAEHVGAAGSGGYFSVAPERLTYRATNTASQRLVWYDRQGTVGGELAARGLFDELALSPDGTRVAFFDGNLQADIWVTDLARKTNSRLTFDAGSERWPIWSANGDEVFYGGGAGEGGEIFRKRADGSGEPEMLVKAPRAVPQDSSPDGKFLLYLTRSGAGNDLWILPLDGDRKPVRILANNFVSGQAQFSPDGRWVAYMSAESGRPEIYVRPFSPTLTSASSSAKWMISNNGGTQPRWRADGREIVYVSTASQLTSVAISASADSIEADPPKSLFTIALFGGSGNGTATALWDMTPDGKRFLVNTTGSEAAATPITIVENWQQLLKN